MKRKLTLLMISLTMSWLVSSCNWGMQTDEPSSRSQIQTQSESGGSTPTPTPEPTPTSTPTPSPTPIPTPTPRPTATPTPTPTPTPRPTATPTPTPPSSPTPTPTPTPTPGPTPPPDQGWTHFTPDADTRIVYVSTSGVDNCRTYTAAEVGTDPFNPPSNIGTCRTLEAGYGLLRAVAPDWLLMKRGDTWNLTHVFDWQKWGTGTGNRRMLIGAYGTGPRPKVFSVPQDRGFVFNATNARAHLAVTDFWLSNSNPTPQFNYETGLIFTDNWDDVLIENMRITGYYFNIGIPTQTMGARMSNISIRRNIIEKAYDAPGTNRSQGIFGGGNWDDEHGVLVGVLNGLLIEENVLYRTGLHSPSSDQGHSEAHAIYSSWHEGINYNFVIRNNLFINNSDGGKIGSINTQIDGNVYIKNAIALLACCDDNTSFTRNIVMQPTSYYNQAESIGQIVDPGTNSMLIADNIYTHQYNANFPFSSAQVQAIDGHDWRDITVQHNIVYDWCSFDDWGSAVAFGSSGASNVVFDGNEFQQDCNGMIYKLDVNPLGSGVTYRNNKYFSQQANPFHGLNFSGWVSASGETGATYGRISYAAPMRDAATYMGQPFNSTTGYNAFVNAVLNQEKQSWNPTYTADQFGAYIRQGFNR